MPKKEIPEYKEVSAEKERKLKFIGHCSKCNKDTFHRWDGGTIEENRYRCLRCKTINVSYLVYE